MRLRKANELFRSGRFEQAATAYREVLADRPSLTYVYENLGAALEKMGLLDEALSAFRVAHANGVGVRFGRLREKIKYSYNPSLPLISIIIPVHNTEKYVRECVESVLAQTLKNIEIIIVDDGSTDDSLSIVKSVTHTDPRVRLLSNKVASGNPGTPRNQALDTAKGIYVGFVDSDDWVDRDYYEKLIDTALLDNAEIVFAAGFKNVTASGIERREYAYVQNDPELLGYHESFMIWDKIYRRNEIERYRLRLAETPAAVDVPFILRAYFYLNRWSLCAGLYGYNYRRESDSSVTVKRRKNSDCRFELLAYQDAERWADASATTQYKNVLSFRKLSSYVYTLQVISADFFEQFYRQARDEIIQMDGKNIESMAKKLKKWYLKERFDQIIVNSSADMYACKYRPELYPNTHSITESDTSSNYLASNALQYETATWKTDIKGSGRGVVFLQDWSYSNPYQKLLYNALSEVYGVRARGFSSDQLSFQLLEAHRDSFSVLHLHWLHTMLDLQKVDGDKNLISCLAYARKLGYKILYTAHNIVSHDTHGVKKERELIFRRRVMEYVDYVIAHGAFAKSRLINELWVDEDKIHVVEHGHYVGFYENNISKKNARSIIGLDQKNFVFLFFGNIKAYKGLEDLIQVFRSIEARFPFVRLLIAGRVLDDRIKPTLDGVKGKKNIILHEGFVKNSDVQVYMNASDVVVLPYRNILTSGAALLGLSFKKPLIAPSAGLLPELIDDGKQGYLFRSKTELFEKMVEVASDFEKGIWDESKFSFDNILKELDWGNLVRKKPFNTVFGAPLSQ